MERKTYNGWTNYETWLVSLWTDGDWYITELAATSEDHKGEASQALKEYVQETYLNKADNKATLASDLLNTAMSEVNWYEIMESRKEESE